MGELKQKWRNVRPDVVSVPLYWVVRIVGSTLRVKPINFPESDKKTIFCGWHGRSFVFAHFFRNRRYWVIISQSRDGDMQNTIFKRLGFQTIRGSTGRGGVRAAVEAIKVLNEGQTMAMTPDGPRGPSGVIQGGVMLMARKSGCRLIPVGISARPRWLAGSWDRYMLPLMFAKAILLFGDPLQVPPGATDEQVEEVRLKLEAECHRLQGVAEGMLGIKEKS